jgi:hypothetical protein
MQYTQTAEANIFAGSVSRYLLRCQSQSMPPYDELAYVYVSTADSGITNLIKTRIYSKYTLKYPLATLLALLSLRRPRRKEALRIEGAGDILAANGDTPDDNHHFD